MLANNEIGTIQPIQEIAEIAHKHNVPLHTDAIAAVGQIPVSFKELNVDAMSIAAHKFGGPPAAGALIIKRNVKLHDVVHGGIQERNQRGGTLDVPALAAFAAALTEATADLDAKATQMAALRNELVASILATIPGTKLQGPPLNGNRLPGNALITFEGTDADALLLLLDNAGIAASAGAACSAGVHEPSHVLRAIGVPEEKAKGALRFTLSPATTSAEIAEVIRVLPEIVQKARSF